MRVAGRIGPFVVERELGRGGMGAVYAVRDPQLPRAVALKLLHTDDDPRQVERFWREAAILARLQHPNVVKIHRMGELPEGPFLLEELVEGEGLRAAVARGPFAPARAAQVARGLADALVAVHAAGVVHRDLKPDNVILRPDGAPVLLDFGVARDLDAERLTRTGALVGTLGYMAPEQVRSKGVPGGVDARADVYALGAVLYELLTGRMLFEGPPTTVLYQILSEDPPSVSEASPDVPRDLEAIVRKALAKRREDRYGSARALRDELDRFLAGRPAFAREAEVAAARRRRRRFAAAAACVLGLVAAAAAVASTATSAVAELPGVPGAPAAPPGAGGPEPSPGRRGGAVGDPAEAARPAAVGEAGRPADGGLAREPGSATAGAAAPAGPEDPAADAATVTAPDPARAAAIAERALDALEAGDLDAGIEGLREAVRLNPGEPLHHAQLGHALGVRGDVTESAQVLQRAVQLDPSDAQSWYFLGLALFQYNRFSGHGTDEDLEQAVHAYTRCLLIEELDFVLCARGNTLRLLGRLDEALRDLERALELDPGSKDGHFNRALTHLDRGDLGRARADLDWVVARHPRDHQAWFQRGRVRLRAQDPAGGRDDLARAARLAPALRADAAALLAEHGLPPPD